MPIFFRKNRLAIFWYKKERWFIFILFAHFLIHYDGLIHFINKWNIIFNSLIHHISDSISSNCWTWDCINLMIVFINISRVIITFQDSYTNKITWIIKYFFLFKAFLKPVLSYFSTQASCFSFVIKRSTFNCIEITFKRYISPNCIPKSKPS